MTWTFVVMLIFAALAKIVLTCLPTGVVEWLISKFELHPTLHEDSVNSLLRCFCIASVSFEKLATKPVPEYLGSEYHIPNPFDFM
ncbi:YfmQ family protein [Metabacillus sp. Hm71]|uniref:YfmQ family protein n=1 Tax=Metabacillus sp. Hm71 TaxID=3450743 RepID=UPI003F433C76